MRRGLRDIVYGAAVGDALGVPFEFKARGSFACDGMRGGGTHGQPQGTWSDDTAMLLATCDSIRECGRIDVDDLRARFRAWFDDGAYTPDGVVFDYGMATARALREGRGCAGEYDNGNGSLMRIAPLACTDVSDDEIRAVSAITHAHEVSMEACVRFVHLLREVLDDAAAVHERLAGAYADRQRQEIESSGFVKHTYDAALWSFATTDNYRDCVIEAVELGSDTDTTACVAGALAGAAYGYEAIPQDWVAALRGQDVLEACLF